MAMVAETRRSYSKKFGLLFNNLSYSALWFLSCPIRQPLMLGAEAYGLYRSSAPRICFLGKHLESFCQSRNFYRTRHIWSSFCELKLMMGLLKNLLNQKKIGRHLLVIFSISILSPRWTSCLQIEHFPTAETVSRV